MYGRDFYNNQDCVDCDHIIHCTLCYEVINCRYAYNCSHLQDSENCNDCDYGYDLKGCRNCFGCATLRNKQYQIFNVQHSKEDYEQKLKELKQKPKEETENLFNKVKLKTPRVYCVQNNSENFFGNYVDHCQNTLYAFDVVECQDTMYIYEAKKCRDSYDIFVLEDSELCYNLSSCHVMHNCNCCFFSSNDSDCEYSELLINCDHCFGYIALHHKKYHILNKPYEKEAYFAKVAEIKQELLSQNLYGVLTLPPTYPIEDTVGSWRVM